MPRKNIQMNKLNKTELTLLQSIYEKTTEENIKILIAYIFFSYQSEKSVEPIKLLNLIIKFHK